MARTPSHRRPARAALRILTVAAVLLAGLLPAATAQAEPSPAEIEAMIDKKWQQLEPTIEQYNKVRNQLAANRKKAAELQKRLGPLSQQAERALDQVGALATTYYKTGPSSELNALLSGGAPGLLPERLTLLQRLAEDEHKQVAALTATRDRYAAEKQKLDALIAQQARQEAELAAKKKVIEVEIKRLERMQADAERAAAQSSGTSSGTSSGGSGTPTTVQVGSCPSVSAVGAAAIAVKTACAQIGDPYVWGAAGPDAFDCSGLTQYAWGKAGVSLTHHTGDQWNETTHVSSSEARAGDLVFFYSDLHHVGLYLGNGMIVHASRAGKPVQVASVSYMPVAGYRRVG
ncbi:MAG TPA: NlpC/P60 family protein [Micromonosporaceae bacterium]|nr:NlpC/P60 family protein [Micromonosporaceae bacterium]